MEGKDKCCPKKTYKDSHQDAYTSTGYNELCCDGTVYKDEATGFYACCDVSNGESYVGAINGRCCGGLAHQETQMTETYTWELNQTFSIETVDGLVCCIANVEEIHHMEDGSTSDSRKLYDCG